MTDVAIDRPEVGTTRKSAFDWAPVKKVGFYLLLALIAFYLVFPFYWAINSSLKTESQLAMTPTTS